MSGRTPAKRTQKKARKADGSGLTDVSWIQAFLATFMIRTLVALVYVGGQFYAEETLPTWATHSTLYAAILAVGGGLLDIFLMYMGVFSGISANVIAVIVGKSFVSVAIASIVGSYAGEVLGLGLIRIAVSHLDVRGLTASLAHIVPIIAVHGFLYAAVFFILRPVDMLGNLHKERVKGHMHESKTTRVLWAALALAICHGLFVLLFDGTHTPIFDSISGLAIMTVTGVAYHRWWVFVVYNTCGTALALVLYVLYAASFELSGRVVDEGDDNV